MPKSSGFYVPAPGKKIAFAPNLAIVLNVGVLASSALQVLQICLVH